MKKTVNYNIGLDIGVGSVGWCVTDENSNILKRNGKNLWGARIFNEAETAVNRRNYRSARRRLTRRKERINMLQSLLLPDMEQEYPNFFQRLRESYCIDTDKKVAEDNYNLFSGNIFNDRSYYKRFPTIYHLRDYLVKTDEKADFRLVYLAIHHIIKYRGNFLYEGDFSNNLEKGKETLNGIVKFLEEKWDIILNTSLERIFDILQEKQTTRAIKKDTILNCFEYDKSSKQIITNVVNAILGYVFSINKIFEIDSQEIKVTFTKDIENEEDIKDILNDEFEIFEQMREIYSWYVLQDILQGKGYISEALKSKYEQYKNDLKNLKSIYKKYFKNEYNFMFRENGDKNYVAYNNKKCQPEDFYNFLKNKMKEVSDECKEKQSIIEKLNENNFLKKINVTENGEIPHQLHQKELEGIINKQSKFYNTLEENKDRILKIFEFRIPYFVGPLSNEKGKFSWVSRKSNEKVRPWNFNEIIDEELTAEEFITRMTNKCTYLINKDVIPKESLLYSKFCVLNELNNIRINDKHIAKDMKITIIEQLFKEKKKVTKKMLQEFLRKDGFEKQEIAGLSDGNEFNSKMNSYIDMKRIFGKVDDSNNKMCEDIIYWVTIFEEKSILKKKILKEYPQISEEQLKAILKLKYTGWSRLSKELLIGLKAYDGDNIMEKLEKTQSNFMQIINNEKYGFDKQIEKLMPKSNKNVKYKDIEDIATSPANKRAIWQSICIVKEISKIMKESPKNIYIEFARSEEEKVFKDKKAKQLLKKYEEIIDLKDYDKKVYVQLKNHQSDKEISEKLYLYMCQNGKCLYSRKTLDIDNLSLYEVDHILPQSYIKDDSIDNKALVIREENQRKKDNLLLDDNVINRQIEWWNSLLKNGLISQSKFYKLARRKMFETDNDRIKFVQRQLVETRQITKHVTSILKNMYENSEIFAIRAELTHGFRKKYNIYKNRNVNNYHHAQDAYILNVIGNIFDMNLKYKDEYKYSEYVKKYIKDEKNSKEKYGMAIGLISKHVDIQNVKKQLKYKDCYVSRMLVEETGSFYNQTIISPTNKSSIPLKENLNIRYGSYTNENKAYMAIFEYINSKNNREYKMIGIPIKVAYDIKSGKTTIEEYIKEKILQKSEYRDLKIVRDRILKNQLYLDENNIPIRLCSEQEIRVDKELILDEKTSRLIYLIGQEDAYLNDDEKSEVQNNYENIFDTLLEKIKIEYKVFENIYEKLRKLKNTFMSLENEQKKLIINGMISLMATGQGNLKAIGLSDREGRMNGKNFDTKKLIKMTFIDKSVTGIYERRFKINGMENNSNK